MATAVKGTQTAAPQGATTGVAVADVAVSLYIDALSGDDDNNGQTQAQAVQTWARLEELLPAAYRVSCTITVVGTTPVTIADGEHTLPMRLGAATPVQIVGSFAQLPAGGAGGTRTIAGGGVGTNTITDSAGGITVDYYNGCRVRFTSGAASGDIYTIQQNTATVFTLAHAFENGATPSPGDTFVVEYPAGELRFNDVLMRSPGPVIMDGTTWNGVGAGSTRIAGINPHILQFSGGPWYLPNGLINSQTGRTWVVDGSLRSYDVSEGYLVDPYPSLIGGLYGFSMYSGDLHVGANASVKGCVVARVIDMVVRQGGVVDLVNSDIKFVNEQDHFEGAAGRYTTTTGNASRFWATTGTTFVFEDGAIGVLEDVDVSASAGNAVYIRNGAHVTMQNVTGTANGGFGVRIFDGGTLRSEGGNTVTGLSGDMEIDAVVTAWAAFDAGGGTVP